VEGGELATVDCFEGVGCLGSGGGRVCGGEGGEVFGEGGECDWWGGEGCEGGVGCWGVLRWVR